MVATIHNRYRKEKEIPERLRQELDQSIAQAQEELATLPPLPEQEEKVPLEEAVKTMKRVHQALKKSELSDEQLLEKVVAYLQEQLPEENQKIARFKSLVEEFEQRQALSLLNGLTAKIGVHVT